jgi:hypothetical protein
MQPTSLHLLMHAAAIKKHGDLASLAAIAGLSNLVAEAVAAQAVANGRLANIDGKYLLTPAGQMIVQSEYSLYCAPLRADSRFKQAYERFELINRDLKRLVTDWQTMEVGGKRVPNLHENREYDAEVIDRLGDLHERFEPVLKQLVAAAPRLIIYARKLAQALAETEKGGIQWVSDAKLDSYHTVWFELHEDLLRLMGQSREE